MTNNAVHTESREKIRLQLIRLQRHFDNAVRTYDEVALLDLSHILRIWFELKAPLAQLCPDFAKAITFKSAIPSRKLLKYAKGKTYVFCYMTGGVKTYASEGEIVSPPDGVRAMVVDGRFALTKPLADSPPYFIGAKMKAEGDSLWVGNALYIESPDVKEEDETLQQLAQLESTSRLTFAQWMAAEAVRLAYVNPEGKRIAMTISREMVIKRVANTLDGSHASVSEDARVSYENAFDAPIKYLLSFKIGGVPLPYFILLKIAQDILGNSPKLGLESSKPSSAPTWRNQ